jgi:hypothetical protein
MRGPIGPPDETDSTKRIGAGASPTTAAGIETNTEQAKLAATESPLATTTCLEWRQMLKNGGLAEQCGDEDVAKRERREAARASRRKFREQQ